MKMIAALLALLLPPAQDAKTVRVDGFEAAFDGWSLLKLDGSGLGEDADSRLAVVRQDGRTLLAHTQQVTAGTLRVLAYARPLDLSGMKSLRLGLRSSSATTVVLSLAETDGASWQCAVTCPAGARQEVAVNLDEFLPDEEGKDANGKLDLDRISSFHVFDLAGFLAAVLPELQNERTIGIDGLAFSSTPAPFTTGPTKPVYVVDNFESPVIRWAPLSVTFGDALRLGLYDAPIAIDREAPEGGGRQSLRFEAPRPAGKVHGVLRNLEKIDLGKALTLELRLKTSADGTYLINLEEKDGSRYDHVLQLGKADGWKALSLAWADFKLADDSQDENDRLDPGELKQILIADATSLLGGAPGPNAVLRIDEVRFLLAP